MPSFHSITLSRTNMGKAFGHLFFIRYIHSILKKIHNLLKRTSVFLSSLPMPAAALPTPIVVPMEMYRLDNSMGRRNAVTEMPAEIFARNNEARARTSTTTTTTNRGPKLRLFRLLFLSTGLYLEDAKRRSIWMVLRCMLVLFFIGLNAYRLCTFVVFLFNSGESRVLSALILVLNIKALTAQLFFCYWQWTGHFSALFNSVICPQKSKQVRRIFWQTLAVCMAMFLLEIGVEALNFVLKQTGKLGYEDKREEQRKVPLNAFRTLFFIVANWWHALFVMNALTVFFNVLCRLIVSELDELNAQLQQNTLDESALLAVCERFLAVVQRVRRVDHAFEAYLLLMIGSNIPATIFILLRLFRQFHNWCWLQFIILLPNLFNCLFELSSLTVMPSILHSRLLALPANLVEQFKVNELLDNHPHNHVRYLVSRLTIQSRLGISLWGFTIITKPLMLSVLSMMVTYLTLVMHMLQQTDL